METRRQQQEEEQDARSLPVYEQVLRLQTRLARVTNVPAAALFPDVTQIWAHQSSTGLTSKQGDSQAPVPGTARTHRVGDQVPLSHVNLHVDDVQPAAQDARRLATAHTGQHKSKDRQQHNSQVDEAAQRSATAAMEREEARFGAIHREITEQVRTGRELATEVSHLERSVMNLRQVAVSLGLHLAPRPPWRMPQLDDLLATVDRDARLSPTFASEYGDDGAGDSDASAAAGPALVAGTGRGGVASLQSPPNRRELHSGLGLYTNGHGAVPGQRRFTAAMARALDAEVAAAGTGAAPSALLMGAPAVVGASSGRVMNAEGEPSVAPPRGNGVGEQDTSPWETRQPHSHPALHPQDEVQTGGDASNVDEDVGDASAHANPSSHVGTASGRPQRRGASSQDVQGSNLHRRGGGGRGPRLRKQAVKLRVADAGVVPEVGATESARASDAHEATRTAPLHTATKAAHEARHTPVAGAGGVPGIVFLGDKEPTASSVPPAPRGPSHTARAHVTVPTNTAAVGHSAATHGDSAPSSLPSILPSTAGEARSGDPQPPGSGRGASLLRRVDVHAPQSFKAPSRSLRKPSSSSTTSRQRRAATSPLRRPASLGPKGAPDPALERHRPGGSNVVGGRGRGRSPRAADGAFTSTPQPLPSAARSMTMLVGGTAPAVTTREDLRRLQAEVRQRREHMRRLQQGALHRAASARSNQRQRSAATAATDASVVTPPASPTPASWEPGSGGRRSVGGSRLPIGGDVSPGFTSYSRAAVLQSDRTHAPEAEVAATPASSDTHNNANTVLVGRAADSAVHSSHPATLQHPQPPALRSDSRRVVPPRSTRRGRQLRPRQRAASGHTPRLRVSSLGSPRQGRDQRKPSEAAKAAASRPSGRVVPGRPGHGHSARPDDLHFATNIVRAAAFVPGRLVGVDQPRQAAPKKSWVHWIPTATTTA